MERLKAFSVEKFTLDGRKFHTLTILSAKYLLRVLLSANTAWFVQFVRMAPSSSYRAELKKSEKFKSTTPKTIFGVVDPNRSISDPNANVVILDSTSQEFCILYINLQCLSVISELTHLNLIINRGYMVLLASAK